MIVATPPLDALGAVRADDDWPDSLGAHVSSDEFFSQEYREKRNQAFGRTLTRLVDVAAKEGAIDPSHVEKHLVTAEARQELLLLFSSDSTRGLHPPRSGVRRLLSLCFSRVSSLFFFVVWWRQLRKSCTHQASNGTRAGLL